MTTNKEVKRMFKLFLGCLVLITSSFLSLNMQVAYAGTSNEGSEVPSVVEKAEDGERLSYTAVSGDSYTRLARKAILKVDPTLSAAKVVAIESWMSNDAGNPDLNIGQVIEFNTTKIKSKIEMANKLSDLELANWQVYANNINLPLEVTPNIPDAGEKTDEANNKESDQDEATNNKDDSTSKSGDSSDKDKESSKWPVIGLITAVMVGGIVALRKSEEEVE
jgi:hypothetical protein